MDLMNGSKEREKMQLKINQNELLDLINNYELNNLPVKIKNYWMGIHENEYLAKFVNYGVYGVNFIVYLKSNEMVIYRARSFEKVNKYLKAFKNIQYQPTIQKYIPSIK